MPILLFDPLTVLLLLIANLTPRFDIKIFQKLVNITFALAYTQSVLVLIGKCKKEDYINFLKVQNLLFLLKIF